jgi:carboxypeptidase Q
MTTSASSRIVTLTAAISLLIAVSCATSQKSSSGPRIVTNTPPAIVVSTNQAASDEGAATRSAGKDPIARIREEGLNHSQAAETLSYLTDVIGARLTGSPSMKRANEWTREKLESWGMANAHLESWGPFGRGWSLRRFSAAVTEPQYFPLKSYPNAWSPSLDHTLNANVVLLDATNNTQLEKHKGKLKGAIVLASPLRTVPLRLDPPARRYEATNLLQMANATPPRVGAPSFPPRGNAESTDVTPPQFADNTSSVTNSPPRTNAPAGRRFGAPQTWARFLPFLIKEGAALVLLPSTTGDAGTIFVTSASVPQPERSTNSPAGSTNAPRLSAYATNAPATLPQITVAVEDYNRLVRMTQLGEKLKISVELEAQFHNGDVMAYNTVAEIPGGDLKNEIVMVGAHLDSWHSGTGATDNGVGCVAAMEALRIIQTLKLQPRRTIRVALWSGEEEGLLGSRAYVTQHFGHYKTNATEAATTNATGRARRARTDRELIKEKDYDNLSAYFNLDNGAGKIRGIYMQGNEAVRPYFRKWLEPFRELGAESITPSNTGGTDHLSFDNVGLPAFQFIQDPLDYATRTHHSNEDVFDRIQPEDLKQAATVIATFLYNAAMLDEKLPRKPAE